MIDILVSEASFKRYKSEFLYNKGENKMKKIVIALLTLALCLSCATTSGDSKSVLLLVPSAEGSYFSAAVLGVKALEEKYPGTKTKVVEMGAIPMEKASAAYELECYMPFFEEGCKDGNYDLIVCMGAECNAALIEAAKKYPEQKFFSCDLQGIEGSELETSPLSNVYGLMYKNKDIGYLAGYVAAQVTQSDMPNANPEKKVGVIVGVNFPGLNEYIGSFCQVCAEEGVEVYIDYAGDFIPDFAPVVAEKAKAMYEDGVDVIWQVAGSAGSGVFTAAKEAGRYSFGVDCDQTKTVSDSAEAATIVTSFYADYAAAIDATFASVLDGSFHGGTYPLVGLAEGFIGYAHNDQFVAMAPQSVQDAITELYAEAKKGTLDIFSVIDDPEGWEALKAEVAPKN